MQREHENGVWFNRVQFHCNPPPSNARNQWPASHSMRRYPHNDGTHSLTSQFQLTRLRGRQHPLSSRRCAHYKEMSKWEGVAGRLLGAKGAFPRGAPLRSEMRVRASAGTSTSSCQKRQVRRSACTFPSFPMKCQNLSKRTVSDIFPRMGGGDATTRSITRIPKSHQTICQHHSICCT